MLGADPDIGTSALRLWVAAGAAALLVCVCILAFDWARSRAVTRIGVVMAGALFGGLMAWAFFAGGSVRDQSAERWALEMRAAELNAQALAPGSPLACLDALAGDTVETACEKALFATPAAVAGATSYVAARLTLLSDVSAYTSHGGGRIDNVLLPLQHALEADRFGFVAHALAMRDACTSQNCKALSLLHDPSHVRANLSGQTLDRYLDHYAAVWSQPPETPTADASALGAAGPQGPQNGAPGQRKVMIGADFPDASSIPAVSIMNPEPKGPMTPAAAAAAVTAGADTSVQATANAASAAPQAGAPAAAKKPARKQAVNPSPAATAQSVPPPNPVEPVWSPGATLASPQGIPAPAPAPGGPVQLNPYPVQPEASAGGAGHAQ